MVKRAASAVCVLALVAAVAVALPPATRALAESFPGVNGKLAFVSDRDGNDEIYTVDPDGGGEARLTFHAGIDREPTWSPDGGRLAFTRNSPAANVWAVNADGSDQTNLTSDPAPEESEWEPSWSPDGGSIAYARQVAGEEEIYVMGQDGTGRAALTGGLPPGILYDHLPSWSPDGSKIVFVSEVLFGDGPDVYSIGSDGSDRVNLTDAAGQDILPTWSPDGTKIAFTSIRSGNNEVWVMNADGTNPVNLTSHTSTDIVGSWSPDGAQIAFTSDRDGNPEIYVMDADGSNQTRITNNPAADTSPSWQPMRPPTVSVGSASVVEGDSGKNRAVQFAVTLSEPATGPTKVGYRVQAHNEGSEASAPADFALKSGSVTFKPSATTGRSSTTLWVTAAVKPDVVLEGDETFSVLLTSVTGTGLSGQFALGGSAPVWPGSAETLAGILDDDPGTGLRVSVGDASVWEGDIGQKATSTNNAKVWASLSSPATDQVTVRLTVAAGTATGGSDFKTQSAKTLTFKPGQWQKAISVAAKPDLVVESDETVTLTLTNPSNGLVLNRDVGTVTILNDD